MGWKAFLSYSPESSEEGYMQRSMLDSLFPELDAGVASRYQRRVLCRHKVPVAVIREIRPEGFDFSTHGRRIPI